MHIDPELDGGITGTMKLAHYCDAIGMEVQLHTAGPMHRHCMAATGSVARRVPAGNGGSLPRGATPPQDPWGAL